MKKHDFIVIASILLLAAAIFAALHFGMSKGSYVQIQVDNQVIDTLPLDEDTEKEIKTEYGTNILLIRDGQACVTEADCPDKICVHTGLVTLPDEPIVCLPHRVTARIVEQGGR